MSWCVITASDLPISNIETKCLSIQNNWNMNALLHYLLLSQQWLNINSNTLVIIFEFSRNARTIHLTYHSNSQKKNLHFIGTPRKTNRFLGFFSTNTFTIFFIDPNCNIWWFRINKLYRTIVFYSLSMTRLFCSRKSRHAQEDN